jgi:hypothetical protein
MADARLRADARACQVHLTQAQLDRLARDVAAAAPASPHADLPQECQELIALMQRLMQCPAMQQMNQGAAQVQAAVDQMVTGWRDAIKTPAGRQSTADACRAARDGVKQSIGSLGCP